MKRFNFILVLFGLFCSITFIILSCTQHKTKPIEGAWNLVYTKGIKADTLVWRFPGDGMISQIKIWSANHFIFVGIYKLNQT